MREQALYKVGAMLEVAKRDLNPSVYWKLDQEGQKKCVESQQREVDTLQYIYNLIENE